MRCSPFIRSRGHDRSETSTRWSWSETAVKAPQGKKSLSDSDNTTGAAPKRIVSKRKRMDSDGDNIMGISPKGRVFTRIKLGGTPLDPQELKRRLEELNCVPMQFHGTVYHHFSILHVLDLSYTEIKYLPQSISKLVALQKLFLRGCELLMKLPPEIGQLTNLEVLDLEGTKLLYLPKEIAKLVNLMCLKVSFFGCSNQTVVSRRVLSKLSCLIELIIDVTPYGEWWDVEVEAIIDDLCTLKELRTLKLHLPTTKLLDEELTLIFPSLENFRFTVGHHEEHFISRLPHDIEEEFNNWEKLKKGLKYINGSCIPNEITRVLKHANGFFLQRHWTAKSLSEFGHGNIDEVKFCLVTECNEFRTIIDSERFYWKKEYGALALVSLEKLVIRYMKNMQSIWRGAVGKGSMSNLKSLALHTCPKLTTLFTVDMLVNLINLEELIVEDCPKLESLVSLQSTGSKPGLCLQSLKKISLLELPELVSISNGLRIAPNLERMVIFYCPKLEKLSAMEVSSTCMKVIKGEKEWWDALKWYESDLGTKQEDYLAGLFIPLRRDGDLMAQLTKDEIAAHGQGKVGSYIDDELANKAFKDDEKKIGGVDGNGGGSDGDGKKSSNCKRHQHSREVRVPALSMKMADIPQDDYTWRIRGSPRRRRSDVDTRTVVITAPPMGNTKIPPEDGFTWRKYGQKEILGSTFPRSYYRCTHSKLYNCSAKKQVQRLDNNPFTFEVTYRGDHNCHMSSTALSASPGPTELMPPSTPETQPPSTTTSPHAEIPLGVGSSGGGGGAGSSSIQFASDTEFQLPVADLGDVMFNSGPYFCWNFSKNSDE